MKAAVSQAIARAAAMTGKAKAHLFIILQNPFDSVLANPRQLC